MAEAKFRTNISVTSEKKTYCAYNDLGAIQHFRYTPSEISRCSRLSEGIIKGFAGDKEFPGKPKSNC